jgi:CubicO group peptidase (beta-lactamase class C family)
MRTIRIKTLAFLGSLVLFTFHRLCLSKQALQSFRSCVAIRRCRRMESSLMSWSPISFAEHHLPGLTMAIVQAPYVPRSAGYGKTNIDLDEMASTKTMWNIGPITQAFTAVAIMQLKEQGKLSTPILSANMSTIFRPRGNASRSSS